MQIKRLKDLLKSNLKYGLPESGFSEDEIPENKEKIRYIRITDIQNETITNTNNRYLYDVNDTHILNRNDILFARSGATVGKTYIFEHHEKSTYAGYLIKLTLNNRNNPKYVYYYLNSFDYWKQIREKQTSSTIENVNSNILKNIKIAVHEKEKQNKIVFFLDENCSKLNKEIFLLEKKSILLDEYKNALIYETVTKGLDKNAEMKDSGVEWIGEIPKNWTVNRLKDKLNIQKGSVFTDDLSDDEGLYPYINGGVKPSGWTNAFNCMEKTIAVSEGGASSGYSQYMETKFWAGSHCYNITPRRNDNSKYYYYLLKGFEKEIQSAKTGSAMPNLQKSKFTNLIFSFTSNLLEQNSIVEFLDLETKKIEKQIELINKKVELLKEYKQSLIYEAVTGQLEIE